MAVFLGLPLAAGVFAAWAWLRPYSWHADHAAGCEVVDVHVREDHGYYWVEPHLRLNGGKLDFSQPIRLVAGSGKEFELAETQLGTEENFRPGELWLKFWVERKDLGSDLRLRINGCELVLKSNEGQPRIGPLGFEYFTSCKW